MQGMNQNRKYDVFLSHNSVNKELVEELARRLQDEAGLRPFLDKWHLVPGRPWVEELETSLLNSASVAVFFGDGEKGPWHHEEMQFALNRAVRSQEEFRIIPVLLPGACADSLPGFLEMRTWVDFRSGIDDNAGFERLVAGIKGQVIESLEFSLPDEPAPYRGLLGFEEQHSAFFFGRDRETRAVVDKLSVSRFVTVVGASGSGKSSLVRAGVLPRLEMDAIHGSCLWVKKTITPGSDPFRAVADALSTLVSQDARQLKADELTERMMDRKDGLRTGYSNLVSDDPKPLLLVVDQFEELFTHDARDSDGASELRHSEQFIANLTDATLKGDGLVRIIATLRADFVGHCLNYAPLTQLLQDGQILLPNLDDEGLREAIVSPAQSVGAFLENGLASLILRDVVGQYGALPLMQHALHELWLARRGPWLTLEVYESSGGVRGALRRRADNTIRALSEPEREIARGLLMRLTTLGEGIETRRRVRREELYSTESSRESVDQVINALSGSDARLVVVDSDTVEIAHEALIQEWSLFREWLDEDRDGLRIHRRLTHSATEWEKNSDVDDYLYRGTVLRQAQNWESQLGIELNKTEAAFLEASVELQSRTTREQLRQRRGRWRLLGALAAVSLLVAGMVIAVVAIVSQAPSEAWMPSDVSSLLVEDAVLVTDSNGVESIRVLLAERRVTTVLSDIDPGEDHHTVVELDLMGKITGCFSYREMYTDPVDGEYVIKTAESPKAYGPPGSLKDEADQLGSLLPWIPGGDDHDSDDDDLLWPRFCRGSLQVPIFVPGHQYLEVTGNEETERGWEIREQVKEIANRYSPDFTANARSSSS